jgi:hypothetical protein
MTGLKMPEYKNGSSSSRVKELMEKLTLEQKVTNGLPKTTSLTKKKLT